MKKQIIITIGREFGSGGHYIAQCLSQRLGIKLYDKEFLYENGFSKEIMDKYDEKPINVFLSKRIGAYSNSIEEHLAERQFNFIKSHAETGESFVVVGRCAEHILRGNPNVVSVFVCGDVSEKIKRIMDLFGISEKKAYDMLKKEDRKRKSYHNYYCDIKWGDSRGYDICINSSRFGLERTVDAIINIITAE